MTSGQPTPISQDFEVLSNQRTEVFSGILFAFVVLLVVFSVEFPLSLGISEYESINTEDIAAVFLLLWLMKRVLLDKNQTIRVLLPAVTTVLLVTTIWVVLTLGIAAVRSSESVAASALWVLKWSEVVVVFITVQSLLKRYSAAMVVRTTVAAGAVLSVYSIYSSQFTSRRVRVFFNNPNTLAAFLILVIAISFAGVIANRGRAQFGYALSGLLSGGAMLTTLSRTGMIGLLVLLPVLLISHYRYLTIRVLIGIVAGTVVIASTMSYLLQDRVDRYFDWIEVSPDGIKLANSTAASSFKTRLELLQKSLDLWVEQPIFGYGWFASPSRVGYLDNLYSILLVELGLPGILLMFGLYAIILRALFQAGQGRYSYLSNAVLAWSVGLLAMGIGGAFARVPQVMMLWLLLLTAVRVLAEEGGLWIAGE